MRRFFLPNFKLIASAAGTFFLFSAQAQPAADTSLKSKDLSEVVVTGQYKPQSVKGSVYQVKVINKDRIQKQAATRLQDVLSTEMNIRFSQDGATGSSNITMMGLAGQNVKILLDGMPLIGRQGTNNEININQVDINSIERIEIIEGPMSVIYGADALGGVINIITKKGTKDKWSITAKLHEESVGNEYSLFSKGIHNPSVSGSYRFKNWVIGATGSYHYFGGWKGNATGRDLQWHKKDQLLASGFAQYNTPRFNLLYRIDGLDEIITNPDSTAQFQQSSGDYLYFDYAYLSQRLMQQLQSTYIINNKWSLQGQAAYSFYSRQVYATTLSQLTGAVRRNKAPGANSEVDFSGFTFKGSALYRLNDIFSFQPGVDINLEKGSGERMHAGTNEVNDYAFFITSEITPTAKINLKPGLRFIKNSVYDAPAVIPALNTKFKLSNQFDLRMSYARGFRSPSLRELYFNFFDANHQIIGNPNLKAETSHSFNGSLNWSKLSKGRVAYASSLSAFYNNVKNLIDYTASAADPNIFQLNNVNKSTSAGMGLQSTAKYKQWYFAIGTQITGFYNSYSEADKSLPKLQWSAEANTNLSYSFAEAGLDVNLFYKFTGKRPRYVQESSGGFVRTVYNAYHWADLTFNKKLGKYITANAGLRNLFDVTNIDSKISSGGVHSNGGRQMLATGRSGFVGIVFNISKKQSQPE